MTAAEIKVALDTVNTAIAQLLSGKRVLELRVGSGNFFRQFRYGEVTLDALKEYRTELMQMLQTIDAANATPSFRTYATVPLVVKKARACLM
jgi:hypothetical protein